ncbi:MAG: hypothetical protein VW546_09730 [Gammaproteobacteria bacterium]
MAGHKISRGQLKKLVLISSLLGVIAGVYYALSPYQECVRETRWVQPDIDEGTLVNICASAHSW